MSSVGDIQTIPGELFAKFQTSFYADPVDAVFKELGVEQPGYSLGGYKEMACQKMPFPIPA
ncbi:MULTISPECIES: hypothetical protein [Desulfonatronospira]|uniref:hypothetical protein n=1 Tax=Desulfonatronospira TaxID=488937 RepID=UPI000197480F|nr:MULTISPECIES: hypothetical protein [Desulfonatronospira]